MASNEELLKGNFKVKNPVEADKEAPADTKQSALDDYRKKALSSVGGSMVYMERTDYVWDGKEDK